MKRPFLFDLEMSSTDREYLFRQTAIRTGLPAYILEKDYMVCIVLTVIFEEIKPQCTENTITPFLFKGGTSLSKVYGIINRMSEDVDLSINMQFLGYPEPDEESNSARDRRVKQLLESNISFVSSTFMSLLETELSKVHMDFKVYVDSSEPQNLIIHYPRSLADTDYVSSYIQPHVLIETGGRAAFDPHSSHPVSPFIKEEIMDIFQVEGDCRAIVDVLDLERTFFEKLTLLHELNHRGVKAFHIRLARHIYDLIQIYTSKPEVVDNLALLEDVRKHKEKYFRRGSAKWEFAVPGSLFILPPDDIKRSLIEDWEKMGDLFPGGILPYSFDEMMSVLENIDKLINK